MRASIALSLVATLFVMPGHSLLAQAAGDPSGHWEGTVQGPNIELKVVIDLTKTSQGAFAGTFGQPAEGVKGFPLSTVSVDQRSVRFVVKGGPEPATFVGLLSADGASIAGNVTQAGVSMPLNLARTGDAVIAPAPKNPPIGKEMEGTWNGTLDLNGQSMRIVVKMANQPDGTATGTVFSPDGSGVEIPIAIRQKASTLTIEVASTGASYVGALSATGNELTGTWSQGPAALPLTLSRTRP